MIDVPAATDVLEAPGSCATFAPPHAHPLSHRILRGLATAEETPGLVIREFNALDLERGFLETLASLSEVALTVEQAREVFRNRLRGGVLTYVAVQDEQVVGTISLLVEQKFIHGGGRCGHVEDVAVHRRYQKRGIATALINHALDEARRMGCYKVILDCFDHLIPFYERHGFGVHNVGMRVDLQ